MAKVRRLASLLLRSQSRARRCAQLAINPQEMLGTDVACGQATRPYESADEQELWAVGWYARDVGLCQSAMARRGR